MPEPGSDRDQDLVGLLAVVGAGLLPVVFIDDLYWGAWAPKAAICLMLAGPGLVLLIRMLVTGSLPACLAFGFLGIATVSTAVSDRPALSLVGTANLGTGLLFVATLAGCWALGANAGERRRRQMVIVIIAAAVANAAVAWSQARVGDGGRTAGLMGNPVFLGGLVAGALLMVGRRFGLERRSWWWLPAVVLLAGAAQLSGGRAAVALALLALLASLRGAGSARAAALLAAVAVGVVLAPLGAEGVVLGSNRVSPPGAGVTRTGTAPAAEATDTRFAVWRISAGAVRDRPLVGWGPGRLGVATSPRYDAVAAQEGVVLKDAHNWVVEYAVTTGLLGLALLLAWLGTAAWKARGPLAGFALVVAASGLVQPQHVALTPLAMLALGAAAAGSPAHESEITQQSQLLRGAWAAAALLGLGAGLTAGVVLLAGQIYLGRGVQNGSIPQVQRAVSLSPPWPEVLIAESGVEADRGITLGPPYRRKTLALIRRAAGRDPADSSVWAELGAVELAWGSDARAASAFRRALERNPWEVGALLGLVKLAQRRADQGMLTESCRRLRTLNRPPSNCPAAPR
ncbi:MAG TPA: O-antigen ligase family protein [Acidimicrobiales bacterium]|nr:O-antigen ligase family protein [Acidimicrobiales bacterium]